MSNVAQGKGELQHCKQVILEYMTRHIGLIFTVDDLASATQLKREEVQIALETLAYEHEITKEYIEGGRRVYVRKS
jgi:hypothetical protein